MAVSNAGHTYLCRYLCGWWGSGRHERQGGGHLDGVRPSAEPQSELRASQRIGQEYHEPECKWLSWRHGLQTKCTWDTAFLLLHHLLLRKILYFYIIPWRLVDVELILQILSSIYLWTCISERSTHLSWPAESGKPYWPCSCSSCPWRWRQRLRRFCPWVQGDRLHWPHDGQPEATPSPRLSQQVHPLTSLCVK